MTFQEARDGIGSGVVYRGGSNLEDGVITGVNAFFVFVRYAGDSGSKATRPEDLDFLGGSK